MSRRGGSEERGSTLVEVLLVVGLMALIMSGAAGFMVDASRLSRIESDRVQMHQAERVLFALACEDLRLAGYGLNFLSGGTAVDSVLLTASPPYSRAVGSTGTASDAVTTRRVDGARWTHLASDVASTTVDWLSVDSVAGFAVSDHLIIYDATGDYDIREVLEIDSVTNPPRLRIKSPTVIPPALMKTYAFGSAGNPTTVVGVVLEVTYALDAAALKITRSINGGAAETIVEQVETLAFIYFDGPSASDVFVPATELSRRDIVRVRLSVGTRSKLPMHLHSGDYRRGGAVTSVVLRRSAS